MLKLLQLHPYAPTVVFSFVTQSRHNQDTLSNLRTFNTKILRFRVSRSTFFNSDLNYFLLSTFREQRQTILILDTRSSKRISHLLSSCTLHTTFFFISFRASSILASVRFSETFWGYFQFRYYRLLCTSYMYIRWLMEHRHWILSRWNEGYQSIIARLCDICNSLRR